jgi:hypothetical protein
VNLLAFGGNSSEQIYMNGLGSTLHATNRVNGMAAYLLLLKIVSQDASHAGNYDQIFLTTFQSGVDTPPATDTDLSWTLVGSIGANSGLVLDRIALTAGSTATWTFDELRIGDTYSAVVQVPEPGPIVLLGAALALLPLWLRRR